jgi:hypothetical protein
MRSVLDSASKEARREGGMLKGLGSVDSSNSVGFDSVASGEMGASMGSMEGMTAIEKLEVNLKKKKKKGGAGGGGKKEATNKKKGLLPGLGAGVGALKLGEEEGRPTFTRDFSNPEDKQLLNEAMHAARKARETELRVARGRSSSNTSRTSGVSRGRLGSNISRMSTNSSSGAMM